MTDAITESSGNVFDDLGLKDAGELTLKAVLALQVASIIRHRRLSQKDAGELLGIPQSRVSRIMNAKLDGITADRLLRMLLRLGRDIDIRVRKGRSPAAPGRLSVETDDGRGPVAA
ncbi:MAG: XRE family transcriptional regulator [Rubellimicrobium sp.]|nr:XRE family transcriptional regulator [Rubellimicrobium sp.]